ncbi:MAG: EscU/YscU/HrcU family type III secretion system export apparatus switch protein [Planctomycetia bacterium]|nr:EscU/YscU/HrcU family type III secretion system export apparatus switch protein [Planctomycetia bacterium]
MAEDFGEKTYDATPHRREKAREEGSVARSHDLVLAVTLVAALGAFWFAGGGLSSFLQDYAREHLGGQAWLEADRGFLISRWWHTLQGLSQALLPLLGTAFLAAVLANIVQGGLFFLPEKLLPRWERINPLANLRRMFALQGWVKLVFSVFKLTLVGGVAYLSLRPELERVASLSGLSFAQVASYLFDVIFWTLLKIGGALLLLAVFEYGFQWWKHEQDLRMTFQEVREEYRLLQGDPQILARRRSVHRQMILNSLSRNVPKATFVVTNPTELAIAIRYDMEQVSLPIVVAKGAGLVAQRIRRIALEHGIPIVERKALAQALYQNVEVNQPVPRDLWNAVAEVIRYVYELKGMKVPGT